MTVQLHLWSDYVCPFCLIADELIDRVISDTPGAELIHHPHELRPHPTPTLRPEDEYLPSVWERAVYPIAHRHQVPMRLPTISPQPYTEFAFRGAQYAGDHGLARPYHRRLLAAFFREDLDIGDPAVLTTLATEIGLDPDGYATSLGDPVYAARHHRALAEAARLDITVVPTLIIGHRRINGVATEGVIRRAIDEAAAA